MGWLQNLLGIRKREDANNKDRELVESLAALEHSQWKHWRTAAEQKYGIEHSSSADKAYSELTEEEKEQDREWARRVIDTIKAQEGK